ncbi:TRAP transporter substrate-binding protein DctP [Thiopseudomonas alkaliphila]|uniref:TRAP transporter substrate-binding protein DctP n=1 Tax=Thiopseudomonas alkaliphila TaxID=1697053 RepID=UPI00357116C2
MNRRDFIKMTGALAGAGMLSGLPLSALAKENKPTRLKFDSYISDNTGPSRLDNWFLSELEKRAGDQVNIRRYWSASLNRAGEHLAAVRDKTSEMSLISPGYYQAELPVTRGLEWYYRMDRADALQQVCRDVYQEFSPLREEWEQRHRSKVMYWTNWNYAPLITRKPIRSIEDLKGMRIRGYGASTDVIEGLGATAVPVAAPEVYTSLERGVLDGVYGFDFITAVSYKLHEIAPYMTDIGDGPHAPSATIMNLSIWNAMPESLQNICNEIVEEIYAEQYRNVMDSANRLYVKRALDEGAKFHIWSDDQKLAARDLVQPNQTNKWIERVANRARIDGEAMQTLINAAINKHSSSGSLARPEEIALGI